MDSDLAGYVGRAFGFTLPVGTWSLFSLRAVVPSLRPYDYSKRIDRDWAAAARRVSLDPVPRVKFDTWRRLLSWG